MKQTIEQISEFIFWEERDKPHRELEQAMEKIKRNGYEPPKAGRTFTYKELMEDLDKSSLKASLAVIVGFSFSYWVWLPWLACQG